MAATHHMLGLKKPPTALVAVNDVAAVGAYDAVEQAGLSIPKDLAITGYNDIPLAGRLRPGLTTIHVPAQEFGRAAARRLLEQMEAGRRAARRGAGGGVDGRGAGGGLSEPRRLGARRSG